VTGALLPHLQRAEGERIRLLVRAELRLTTLMTMMMMMKKMAVMMHQLDEEGGGTAHTHNFQEFDDVKVWRKFYS